MSNTAIRSDSPENIALSPILAAALVEFRENGYHGTSVRQIVNRAGLTMPTLYYHHGSKEGVLAALLQVAMDDLLTNLAAEVDGPATAPVIRLRQAVRTTITHLTTRHALATLHREFRFLGDEERARYVDRREQVDALFTAIIADGVRAGSFEVDDLHDTTTALLGMLQSVTDWYRADGPDSPAVIAHRYELLALRLVLTRTAT